MSTKQLIKGLPGKQYEVINNFNKGYNTTVSDGVLPDNVFRMLVNYEMKEEGVIDKRKGLSNNKLNELIKLFYDLKTDPTDFTETLNPGITFNTTLTGKLNGATNNTQDSYQEVFKMLKDTVDYTDTNDVTTSIDIIYDRVLHYKELETQMLDDYQENGDSILLWDISGSVEFEIILSGYYMFKEDSTSYLNPIKKTVFKYIRCKLSLDNASSLAVDPYITLTMDVKIDKTATIENSESLSASKINLLSETLYDSKYLRVVNYNNRSYFTTGYGLYQIEGGILTKIESSNAYKPNAVEITYVGFNILAASPLEWIDNGSGAVDAVKGVFFTLDGEPTKTMPSTYTMTVDKPFKINLITTGTGALGKPFYRKDNGDIDEATNPYIEMSGSYGTLTNANIFTVSEFNLEGKFEIKITKGEAAPYIGYFTAETQQPKEIGQIDDVSNFINGSLYCTIINNQLVLFGGHGYIFFSEFDNFYYFPNYFYIYAIDESGEEVNAIKYFRQFYAVSIGKKFKRLSGSFPFEGDTDGLFPLNDFTGCSNTNTIRQIENNIVFLSKKGLNVLKQGYTGEGTENVQPIDIAVQGDYPKENAINSVVKGNNYILSMGETVELYNYVLGAYYKYVYNVTAATGYTASLSGLFEKDSYGIDYYICKVTNKTSDDTKDLRILDFEPEDVYSDDGNPYSTYFKMSKIFSGTPTNQKKYKKAIIQGTNSGNGLVPLYVVVRVDDVPVLTPETYFIRVDSDTNYIYYESEVNSNAALNLKVGAVLGEMVLGETLLGNIRTQNISLNFPEGTKGKSISIEVYDIYPGESGPIGTNIKPFSISNIGYVYKLKKVKGD